MLKFNETLFLIGPTGAGKTTIGRLLATKLDRSFYDLDEVIEDRCGADIPWIFDVEGEAGFRNREARALVELSEKKDAVVSTGAGVILREDNQKLLMQYQPTVIWLNVDIRTQFERVKHDKNRPLLQVPNPKSRLKYMAKQREPYYSACAGIKIQTGRTSPSLVVRRIIEQLEKQHARVES